MKKRRRIMTRFSLTEVSFVDRPAQEHALAEIRKADGPRTGATRGSPVAGHATKNELLNALLAAHDEAPNALKGECMAVVEKSAGDADLEAVVGQVLAYAEGQFNRMVAEVRAATSADAGDATAAVRETAHGRALEDVIDLAGQMLDALPAVAKADIDFDRRVRNSGDAAELDMRIAKQRAEAEIIDRAKEIQLEKARSGRAVSFLDAYALASAGRGTRGSPRRSEA